MSAARDLATLGNQSALKVDTTDTRIGINSTSPDSTLDVGGNVEVSGVSTFSGNTHVGSAISMYASAGIVSATSFYGDGSALTGVASTDYIITGTAATFNNTTDLQNVVVSGATTANGKVNVNSTLTCSEGLHVSAGVATFASNVTVGGVLTYEDVSNVDSVGLITARTGVRITAGGLIVTAGVSTFTDDVKVNSTLSANEGLHVTAGVTTIAGNQTVAGTSSFAKKTTVNATLEATEGLNVTAGVVTAAGNISATGGISVSASEFKVGSAVTIGSAGVSTFSSGVKLAPNSGLLVEGISSTATAWSSTNDLNLDNGMIQFCSGNLGGTNNTLDIYSSVGINTQMNDNDMIVVTGITSVSATTAFVNAVTIDGIAQQVAWTGGSAPTDGGDSGFDTYTFNIWKVGNAKFNIIGNQVKTS